ncbi:response regulator [Rhodobacteraceae bacterium CY05]|uniref:histidine kinase n=2 Tax=Parasedimentitalea huanghaiensis TaxID=2682100 RepID=A0A6L6WIA5_9RHOB|nr:response regulator [Zongyanglinia huanghaiensis]
MAKELILLRGTLRQGALKATPLLKGAPMTDNILRFWQSLETDDPLDPLFKAAPVLMHAIDRSGTLVRVSQFWADKLGYTVEEMEGKKSFDFLSEKSREYAIKVGQPKVVEAGKIYNVEYDFVCKDGTLLPVLLSAISEYDGNGDHIRSLAIIFDNSEAKRAAAQLQQKQRMEAIGALVGGVAHDFNNLLAVVLGNLEFLQDDPDAKERLEYIEDAMTATLQGGKLTQQLLSYGRKAHLTPSVIDLNEVVIGFARMIRRLLPPNIEFDTVTAPDLWKAKIDTAQLETALLNIVNNARDALIEEGRILITTSNVQIDSDYIQTSGESIDPGRYVMLVISDSGEGMDPDTISRIFDPFFTTKPVGKGSGLGLSMVFGFMRQSNGTIRAYSEKGAGTSMELYFPAELSELETQKIETQNCAKAPLEKLVLCAEDESKVRNIIVRQLQKANYRVVACADGNEALQQIQAGLCPDILLTDVIMPGSVQGPELAALCRQVCPELPVVFISGHPTDVATHSKGIESGDVHLIKPVSRFDLIQTLTELTTDDD